MKVDDYIKNNKHINYCEAVIFPDGTIEDAIPSHTEKLIKICNLPREVLYKKIPLSAAPVPWLVDYTNCCSIWFDFGYLPENLTEQQINTITKLKECGILAENFSASKLFEKSICESAQNADVEKLEIISEQRKNEYTFER